MYQIGTSKKLASASDASALPKVMAIATTDSKGNGNVSLLRLRQDWAQDRIIADDGDGEFPVTEEQFLYLRAIQLNGTLQAITPEGMIISARMC